MTQQSFLHVALAVADLFRHEVISPERESNPRRKQTRSMISQHIFTVIATGMTDTNKKTQIPQ
jgi:hypothetical protein